MAAALLGFTLVTVLGTALALMFSVANVFFRDFSNVVQTLTQFVTFSVPMIYPYSLVEERFGAAATVLPAQPDGRWPCCCSSGRFWVGSTDRPGGHRGHQLPADLFALGLAHLAGALVLLVIAQVVFSRLESKIPEML